MITEIESICHITGRGFALVMKSPVECERNVAEFRAAYSERLIFQGIEYEIIGLDLHCINAPIRVGELIGVVVKEIFNGVADDSYARYIAAPQTEIRMDIEQEIVAKGLTAPRVTPQMLEDAIASEHYLNAHEASMAGGFAVRGKAVNSALNAPDVESPLYLLTLCIIVMSNGFTVVGKSACASPENFDAELGCKIARQDAVAQMWPLLGYHLKQQLHDLGGAP